MEGALGRGAKDCCKSRYLVSALEDVVIEASWEVLVGVGFGDEGNGGWRGNGAKWGMESGRGGLRGCGEGMLCVLRA